MCIRRRPRLQLRPARQHDEAAANTVRERTLAFFAKHLG